MSYQGGGSGNAFQESIQMQEDVMQMQDDTLLDIESQMQALKSYGTAIGEEAEQHTAILGEIDMDVQSTTKQLNEEAKRTDLIVQYDDNWKLMIVIAVEVVVLIVLYMFAPNPV